jgi:hypothetical protein
MKDAMSEMDLDELRSELEDFAKPAKGEAGSAKQQRIIAGFEEIERFCEEHGRLPQHGEGRDIFERIYAVRLDRLRALPECREILQGRDTRGLLRGNAAQVSFSSVQEDETPYHVGASDDIPSDDELAAELAAAGVRGSDIAQLQHVRTVAEKRAAEEIAQRAACKNFGIFKPLFEQLKKDIKSGSVKVIECRDKTEVKQGDFFIVQGQMAYLAEAGEDFTDADGRQDCRLRVIFDNGTESGMLRRSLQKRLWEDRIRKKMGT